MNKTVKKTLIAALLAACAVAVILFIHAKKLSDQPPPEIPVDLKLTEDGSTGEQNSGADVPSDTPTEPTTQPTQPTAEPTQPITEPTQPITEPPIIIDNIKVDLPPYGNYSFTDSEKAFISECAFVGDSICSGLFAYGVLPSDMVVAQGNVGIRSLRDYTFDIVGGSYSAIEALTVIKPKYIIFSMGMNDVNVTSAEVYCDNYLSVLNEVHSLLPSAKLYVASISPISSASVFSTNDHINSYNIALKAALEANGTYGYLDVATSLKDASGGLGDVFNGGDGIHLNKAAYYSILTDICMQVKR